MPAVEPTVITLPLLCFRYGQAAFTERKTELNSAATVKFQSASDWVSRASNLTAPALAYRTSMRP